MTDNAIELLDHELPEEMFRAPTQISMKPTTDLYKKIIMDVALQSQAEAEQRQRDEDTTNVRK